MYRANFFIILITFIFINGCIQKNYYTEGQYANLDKEMQHFSLL